MTSIILATAGYDHSIKFWEPNKGICVRSIPFPDSQVNNLALTPDKQFIAAAAYANIKLFEVGSLNNNPIMTYEGHTSNITAVGFQRDCKWLYSSSEDGRIYSVISVGTVKVWDMRAPGYQRIYETNSIVNTVVLHPNQAELISGDQAGTIKVWDLTKNMCRYQLDPVTGDEVGIRSISIALDASLLVAANSQGTCFVWALKNGEEFIPVQELQAHEGHYILKCLLSPNNKYFLHGSDLNRLLATCGSDHSVRIWETQIEEGEEEGEFALNKILFGHSKWVWDCQFTIDAYYLITVSTDTVGKIWNLEKGDVEVNLVGHSKGITCVALNDRVLM